MCPACVATLAMLATGAGVAWQAMRARMSRDETPTDEPTVAPREGAPA